MDNEKQLSQILINPTPKSIIMEVKKIFAYHFKDDAFRKVETCYGLVLKLFEGKLPGYRKCNTQYHDLDHTLDALLASARLLDGYILSGTKFQPELAVRLLVAALLHDTGYIQEESDTEGTGAKYTPIHVDRSVEFMSQKKDLLKLDDKDVDLVGKIIRCTGFSVDWEKIKLAQDSETVAGAILGTADLLGQMSDRAYLEKLLFLYYEFREADIPGYNTEFDILRNTIKFYEMTMVKLDKDLMGAYRQAQVHFKERYHIDRNLYQEAIERHIAYLKKILADDSTNFRSKLKRNNFQEYIKEHDPNMPPVK